jgi:UPF0176 protein
MSEFLIAAFYHFVHLPDYEAIQQMLQKLCEEHGVRGTVLLAEEGINGTMAGSRTAVHTILSHLRADPRLQNLEHKESTADFMPFPRLKVRLKEEIVALKVPGVDPNQQVGTYVPPQEWNDLISDPEVLVIDTRNDFEVKVGTFAGAINPATEAFRDFPDFVQQQLNPSKHKKVAMFCTGGIRCEKATSYMLGRGFDEVYHLKGGILKYLEEVSPEESLWQGDCFVFDERVTVDHHLAPGNYQLCHSCQLPLTQTDMERPEFELGVSCHHCFDKRSEEDKERLRERQKQMELAEMRGEVHIGRFFNK